MHRCLNILEIVEAILHHLHSSDETDDMITVALTCHLFSEPALNIIWSTLTGLAPLIRCFPDDVLDEWLADESDDNTPGLQKTANNGERLASSSVSRLSSTASDNGAIEYGPCIDC